jgi:hypothetical protein
LTSFKTSMCTYIVVSTTHWHNNMLIGHAFMLTVLKDII